MNALIKQEYDPHLLYHAINITVELEYKVPMQNVYNILSMVSENDKNAPTNISPKDVLELLKKLGDSLESSVLTDEPCDGDSLQSKIKELLRLLGCSLSDQELNKILKGDLSLDEALSKQGKIAWKMIFNQDERGKFRPNRDMVEHMLWCSQNIALESVEIKQQRILENNRIRAREDRYFDTKENRYFDGIMQSYDNHKMSRAEKERNDPRLLEQKANKLRLYIAHMQGYDRDRDGDGGRGVDMTTGHVIDFGDIYIADKEHGSVIEDIDRDGIDIADIK